MTRMAASVVMLGCVALVLLQPVSAAYNAWAQCGGKSSCKPGVTCGDVSWGACVTGYTCSRQSEWYWQCSPASGGSGSSPGASPSPSGSTPTPPATLPTGTAIGKTTRYFDCCKPSCAWPDKAKYDANYPYVATCTPAGLRLPAASVYEQSGCTTGGAWTCTSQQPWAVNSTFAYGFAAAKLKGQGESDWCCGCYQLDFTSGSVKGKTMVVQVTNTGGDLGDNHFDLAIPGGGMGIFKGCNKQFPTTPLANWGREYGGVSTLAACNGLPAALQAACKFRFTWGEGTDDNAFNNPDVSFKRVKCPDVLIQKTNCKRADEPSTSSAVTPSTPKPSPTPSPKPSPSPSGSPSGSSPTPTPSYPTATGKTTRYFDCCKPSCAWPDKAKYDANYPYVATCTPAGLRLPAASVYEQSGCTSGGAWTCTSQQPWAVNSTFAYGFAAAKLKGQGESDWCCGCYQLQFTSGSVKGKTMVVQVTNTGGDLGDNHFDLAIPGGGMGIFKGCNKQFPTTPLANWGREYGGVSTLAACNGLPAALQAACKFRFTWGEGTDDNAFNNPDVSFKRVKCPDVLIQKTNCKRADD